MGWNAYYDVKIQIRQNNRITLNIHTHRVLRLAALALKRIIRIFLILYQPPGIREMDLVFKTN